MRAADWRISQKVSSRKIGGVFFNRAVSGYPVPVLLGGGGGGIYLKQPTDLIDCDLVMSFDEGSISLPLLYIVSNLTQRIYHK